REGLVDVVELRYVLKEHGRADDGWSSRRIGALAGVLVRCGTGNARAGIDGALQILTWGLGGQGVGRQNCSGEELERESGLGAEAHPSCRGHAVPNDHAGLLCLAPSSRLLRTEARNVPPGVAHEIG